MTTIEVLVQPSEEPITLAEANEHLRIGQGSPADTTENSYVTALITVARQRAEVYLNRVICEQTLSLSLDSFPAEIVLPRAPATSVTSITYIDADAVSQTLSSSGYQTDLTGSAVHRIKPSVSASWPATLGGRYNAVTVLYVAGWTLPSASPQTKPIPTPIKQAILLYVADMFENREESVVGTITAKLQTVAETLLEPYRLRTT